MSQQDYIVSLYLKEKNNYQHPYSKKYLICEEANELYV